MLAVIDNYDSFTYNLVHFLGELGQTMEIHRNDTLPVPDLLEKKPDAIVLSPGPCTPNEAGICLDLIREAGPQIPILGVCLGHQSIGQAYGAEVVRADTLMHGKTSAIAHEGMGVFNGLETPFTATRYHSLTLKPETMPDSLIVTARASDGTIMGVQHREHRVHGVQFHPESIASEHGHALLRNFLAIASLMN